MTNLFATLHQRRWPIDTKYSELDNHQGSENRMCKWLEFKRLTIASSKKDVEELELSHLVGDNENGAVTLEKWGFLVKLNFHLPFNPATPFHITYLQEIKIGPHRDLYSHSRRRFTHKCQNLSTIQRSFKRRIRRKAVHSRLGIAVSSEKEQISAMYGLVGLQKYVDRKKPDRGVPAGWFHPYGTWQRQS